MALRDNLDSEVRKILQEPWDIHRARKAPKPQDLDLDNAGATIQAAVLYADLEESTKLVERQEAIFSGQIYKTYLVTSARVILSEQGVITAYDGDRIMAVFTGREIAERAVRSAMKINYVVQEIINPALRELKPGVGYEVKQSVGVDCSELLAIKAGIRTANDMVWIGRAANYAAKLSSRPAPGSHITAETYNELPTEMKVSSDRRNMWNPVWAWELRNRQVYSSSWWMSL